MNNYNLLIFKGFNLTLLYLIIPNIVFETLPAEMLKGVARRLETSKFIKKLGRLGFIS